MTPITSGRVRRWRPRHAITAATLLCLIPVTAGCGSGSSPAPANAASPPVTRWWSLPGHRAGSAIDPAAPAADATKLRISRTAYCRVLRQTVAAGNSILPGATATDPALLTSTKAFVSDVEAVAPPHVAKPWQVVGDALVTLVGSQGDVSALNSINPAAVRQAERVIGLDAKRRCKLDLSS